MRARRAVDRREVRLGEALDGVGHHERHVAALGRLQRADLAVVLDPVAHLAARRRPAVSIRTTGRPSTSISVSIGSRVVPGASCTTTRSSPSSGVEDRALADVRPAHDAERRQPLALDGGDARGLGQALDEGVEEVADPPAVLGRHRVDLAEAELGEVLGGRPRARRSSHLLATSMIGRPDAAQPVGDLEVAGGRRGVDVDHEHDQVGLLDPADRPARRSGGRPRSGSASSMPPVSMSWKARPFHSAPDWRRSRVTPGYASTTASRRPASRLKSVDLPTFG